MMDLLDGAPKRWFDGTHRTNDLGETLNLVAPHLASIGLTRVANVTGLDRIGIPVVMVTRPDGLSLSVYQGKGRTLAAAKVSGIMEAIERHHGETAKIEQIWGRRSDLVRDHAVIDTASLPILEGSRYSDQLEIPWTPMFDIVRERTVLVPYEVVAFQPVVTRRTWCGCFRTLSTGLAAGNSLTEAAVHAICEIVERDAQTIWRYTHLESKITRRLDLSSIDDENCSSLIDQFEHAGFHVAVWDVTHDLGVPTFYACLMDSNLDNHPPSVVAGWGAHPAKEIALSRALTEAAQSRLTLIAGARDDISRHHYNVPDRETLLAYQDDFLSADTPSKFTQISSRNSDDLSKDLYWLRLQLARNGLSEILISDLTQDEYGIPVVRVIVPWSEDGDDVPGYIPGARVNKFRINQKENQGIH